MQRAKRIAVIGAHGVGKNTICIRLMEREKWKKRGLNVTYMPETVRSTMFMDANILEKEIGASVDSCSWLFHRHWSQMLEHEYSCDVLISKRLPLDYVVFNQVAYKAGLADAILTTEYMQMAMKLAMTFDQIYFVRRDPKHELVNDSVRDGRSGDVEMQIAWDERYKEVLDGWRSESDGKPILDHVNFVEGTCEEILLQIGEEGLDLYLEEGLDLYLDHPVN